jgi:hypothetical protein
MCREGVGAELSIVDKAIKEIMADARANGYPSVTVTLPVNPKLGQVIEVKPSDPPMIVLSTPTGMANYIHEFWKEYQIDKLKTESKKTFLPWWRR